MKLLIALSLLVAPLLAMDKPGSSPRKDDKHKKEEKPKTPRDEKQKEKKEIISREITVTRFKDRRASEPTNERVSKSESPQKKEYSPARPSTLGKKRGSLDWTDALKHVFISETDTAKQTQVADSVRIWSTPNTAEEQLAKWYEDAQMATPRTRKIMLCQIMNTPVDVSVTKVKVATDIYKPHYEAASIALYNLPGYISTNISGDQLKIEANKFHDALSAAIAAYSDALLAEAPGRKKYVCENTAKKSPNSPIYQLIAQFEALKAKHPELKKYLDPEVYFLPPVKKS